MIKRHTVRAFAAIAIAAAFGFASNAWGAPITTTTFSNPNKIEIPGFGALGGIADPYPSAIVVSGLTDRVIDVNVSLDSVDHTDSGDIYLVLAGPAGASLVLWNDAWSRVEIVDIDVIFDDEASAEIGPMGPLFDGNYQVTQYEGTIPGSSSTGPDAPRPGFGGDLSLFDGLDPNGTWELWAFDDRTNGGTGSIGGWSLTFETAPVPEPSAALLFGLGSLVVGGTLRRRRA